MSRYHIQGTGGDTYTAVCKLVGLENSSIVHSVTRPDFWSPLIRKIYSLVSVQSLQIVDSRYNENYEHIPKIDSHPHPTEFGSDPEGIEMVWFPDFDFGESPVEGPYKVIAPFAGGARRWGVSEREISREKVLEIHRQRKPKTSVIVCGHKLDYDGEKNLINLSGETEILDAFQVIKDANAFFGVQGLLLFVALSQRIPSVGFVKPEYEKVVKEQRIVGPWRDFCEELEVFD